MMMMAKITIKATSMVRTRRRKRKWRRAIMQRHDFTVYVVHSVRSKLFPTHGLCCNRYTYESLHSTQ